MPSMPTYHMLKFMSEDKPEIINAVVAHRHSYYGRKIVQPETHPVDFRGRKCLDDHKTYTALQENSRNAPRFTGRRP